MAKKRIDYSLAKKASSNAALTEQITIASDASVDSIKEILISELSTNPYQPRIEMDIEQLEELALSIEREGLLQPILVSPNDNHDGYIILAGHRRVEAHKLLHKDSVKALVHQKVSHEQLAIIPIVENLQRDDMDPIENAIAFKRLLDEKIFPNQIQLAKKISVSKSWMSRILSILKLPSDLLNTIREDKFKDINILTALNKLDDKDSIATYSVVKDMTRTEAIKYINSIKNKKQVSVVKSSVTVYKNKITIDTKNIDAEKQKKIDSLVAKIKEIIE